MLSKFETLLSLDALGKVVVVHLRGEETEWQVIRSGLCWEMRSLTRGLGGGECWRMLGRAA